MTENPWKFWTPERDGHAPDDWDGVNVECICRSNQRVDVSACPVWFKGTQYRYRPLQDATYEPDLLAQCLALPQDQREALIEAMQKPTLLPCPFCGNDGRGPIEESLHVCHSEQEEHPNYDCYNVQCDRCTATMGYSESEEDAIDAWNRRAS